MAMEKRDVRLQVFITPSMDDKVTDLADMMGMSKNELVRYAIAQLCAGYETGVRLIRDEINKGRLEEKES